MKKNRVQKVIVATMIVALFQKIKQVVIEYMNKQKRHS